MRTETILGIASLIALVAFVLFAFRQGMKVKPSGDSSGGADGGLPPDASH